MVSKFKIQSKLTHPFTTFHKVMKDLLLTGSNLFLLTVFLAFIKWILSIFPLSRLLSFPCDHLLIGLLVLVARILHRFIDFLQYVVIFLWIFALFMISLYSRLLINWFTYFFPWSMVMLSLVAFPFASAFTPRTCFALFFDQILINPLIIEILIRIVVLLFFSDWSRQLFENLNLRFFLY